MAVDIIIIFDLWNNIDKGKLNISLLTKKTLSKRKDGGKKWKVLRSSVHKYNIYYKISRKI